MASCETLLFGGRGFLGKALHGVFPAAATPDIDIADRPQVVGILDSHRPVTVINAAGKTGRPNVDWCEDHRGETLRSNVIGPLVLAEECERRGIYLVHLSTGCIYDGDNGGQGYSEEDPPNFVRNYYAKTKAYSELLLVDFPVLILRPRMPFDRFPHERNLISKLIGYRYVVDVQNSITYVPDLAFAARRLVDQRATGIFNVVNPDSISPYEICELYRQVVQPDHVFHPMGAAEILRVAHVPRSNCVLSTRKLATQGIRLRAVRQAVLEAISGFVEKPTSSA